MTPPESLVELGFPLVIRLTHAFNIIFLTLLIRSGIEILGGHPMLYFNDHCRPGSEWIRFTSKQSLFLLFLTDKQAHVSKSTLDRRGREAAVHAVGGVAGQR